MRSLKQLAGYTDHGTIQNPLSVSERLQCCIVAFRVMRNNLEALNVDLQDFFLQLYNLLLEYRPDRFVVEYSVVYLFASMAFAYPHLQLIGCIIALIVICKVI